MQLVGPSVTMFDTMKDKRIGEAEVAERFGVPPAKVIDVQALAGDSVDNVPGVPGIGVKTAAQLIGEYGDLENLLAHAHDIKQPKRREALTVHADAARMSKKLVTLDQNVPLEVPIEDLAVRERDGPKLIGFCKAMEFTALTRRVAEATGTDVDAVEAAVPEDGAARPKAKKPALKEGVRPVYRPYFNAGDKRVQAPAEGATGPAAHAARAAAAATAIPFDRAGYETVTDIARLDAWIAEAETTGRVAVDTETTSLDPDAG